MKPILAVLFLAIIPAFAGQVLKLEDVLQLGYAPPELLRHHLDDLGLAADQRDRIIALLEDSRLHLPDLEAAEKQGEEELEAIVRSTNPDSDQAEASLNRLLDAEGAVKRLQLRTILGINAILTPEQRAQALDLSKRDVELEAAFKSKAGRFKTAFDGLGVKPTLALEARGQAITRLFDAGKFEAAMTALDAAAQEVGLDDPAEVALIDFSRFDPGDTDLDALKRRYEDVEERVQKVVQLSTLRQLVQAHDDLETAKASQDVISFGRILTWAEDVLP